MGQRFEADNLLQDLFDLTVKEVEEKKEKIVREYLEDLKPESLQNKDYVVDFTAQNLDDYNNFAEEFLSAEDYYHDNTKAFYKENKLVDIFEKLAYILEDLAEEGLYIYCLVPDMIYFTENKVFLNWAQLKKIAARRPKRIDDDFIAQNKLLLAKGIRSGNVGPDDIKMEAVNYTYTYLFFKCLFPKQDFNQIKRMEKTIKYINSHNSNFPPELKNLLLEINSGQGGYTPVEIFKKIRRWFKDSFIRSAEFENLNLDIATYRQKGLRKETQEDQVYSLQEGQSALLLVADGVSTADIGSGWKASSTILGYFKDDSEVIKDFLESLTAKTDSYAKWEEAVDSFLRKTFNQVQHKVVSILNDTMAGREIDKNKSTMSSTLNIAIITGNWAKIAWVGDSPGFLYRNQELTELLTEHNVAYEQYKKQKNLLGNNDSITRVIPMYHVGDKDKKYVEEDIDNYLEYQRVYLNPNDLLIMGSDGIVDCLEGIMRPDQKEKLRSTIKEKLNSGISINQLSYEITKQGVEDQSNDNISACLAYCNQPKEEK